MKKEGKTMGKALGKNTIFRKIGRKNLVIFCAVLLIGAAVYLNYVWFYNPAAPTGGDADNTGTGGDSAVVDTVSAYFTSTQVSRKQTRDEALETLQTVISNEAATETAKAEALAAVTRIATEMEHEANIESLIVAKGFTQCVAVINGDDASIVVRSETPLKASDTAQIYDIVYQQTGILPENTYIIQK